MEQEQTEGRAAPWHGPATAAVFVLVVVVLTYVGYAWYTQVTFKRLMTELVSVDPAVSDRAADELAATDAALPYLCNALVHSPRPEKRELCAHVILRRLAARLAEGGPFADKEAEQRSLRRGLQLEAITAALQDENPEVRATALKIIDAVGTEQNYQRKRRETMLSFEALLKQLESGSPKERDSASDELREEGIQALPYLVGVVSSENSDHRLRGLRLLRTVVQDILRGSNQRRIVPLLGRRRCQLLLDEMSRMAEEDRSIVTDILNVSGRVKSDFFTRFLGEHASRSTGEGRRELLTACINDLEKREKVRRGGTSQESDRIEDLHDKAHTAEPAR